MDTYSVNLHSSVSTRDTKKEKKKKKFRRRNTCDILLIGFHRSRIIVLTFPLFVVSQSLEQERHLLRRRLEEVISENEARNLELQADVETLRSQLEEQNERARRAERDQASLVAELTAQNTRLADQLREAAKQEEQLLIEVKVLREKCALRSTTLQDHVSSLEVLRDEVN